MLGTRSAMREHCLNETVNTSTPLRCFVRSSRGRAPVTRPREFFSSSPKYSDHPESGNSGYMYTQYAHYSPKVICKLAINKYEGNRGDIEADSTIKIIPSLIVTSLQRETDGFHIWTHEFNLISFNEK